MGDRIVEVIATAFGKLIFFGWGLLIGVTLWWIASPKFDHSTKWTVIIFFAWIVSEIQWVANRMIRRPL